ncbi:Mismatch repair protein msh3 [Elasticomyces elasticus]|nr:Mismatch repair protein msh3 [Elasticomyces elasticus]
MAPGRSPLSTLHTLQSSQKKQQSISSFFSATPPVSKPTAIASSIELPDASNSLPAVQRDADASNQLLVDQGEDENDEDENGVNEQLSQSQKRTFKQDDLEHERPALKRQRFEAKGLTNDTVPDVDHGVVQPDSPDSSPPTPHSHGQISAEALNTIKKPRATDRTSKYLFSSSSNSMEGQPETDDAQKRKQKELLHQRFVKKFGKPDSIAEIKSRNHFITEETQDGEAVDDDEDEEEEQAPKPAARGRRGAAQKKSGSKLTPMEKQVIEIKRQHMDTLLVVEVGYKYRFFGEDARIAAKELSIVCIPGKYRYDEHPSEAHIDRFASASIPVHRLHIHVKRLVSAGHKVGVVRQLETAALKAAGDNRNTPFVRKLTNLYTKGTYIDDIQGLDAPTTAPAGGAPATGHLLCLTESSAKGWGNDEKVRLGIVAVQPATGDIVYDDFEDGFMRSELETRLLHIAPCEFLIVGDISKATDKMIQHLSGSKSNVFGDKARVERVEKPKTMLAQAYSHISGFYAEKMKSAELSNDEEATTLLDKVHKLSEHVTVCLSATITHLTEYGLEHVFDLTKYFQSFSARSHMLLNGNTLTSLEIYQNQTDHTEKGSLFWTLDRTQTRFGQRMLRRWVGRPLLNRDQLDQRIAAVEELRSMKRKVAVDKLKNLLGRVIRNDLEKSLIRIYYKKCGRSELLSVLQTLQHVSSEYVHVQAAETAGFSSQQINEAIAAIPTISQDVLSYLERINAQAAKDNDATAFFREEHETEDITHEKCGIAAVEYDLREHLTDAADKLHRKRVEYAEPVAGIEYLITVDNSQLKNVPASWAKISGTKKVSRFHTPRVIELLKERDQHKEALAAACDAAFSALLAEIGAKYQAFRDCIQALATLDCLLSLAEIAQQPGYVKPEFADDTRIHVQQGRHPMVEQLLLDSYVPNDVALSPNETRALLITGPNMGGKSSYVRSVALIAIMAQIGSYVPADSAHLGLFDAVFTRMGAFDNMMKGESTFMVELSETSDILKQASPRSLVILDELGRGTSTHDGVAIAQAVLDHTVRDIKALTLFITHYQSLARMADGWPRGELRNVHMRFEEQKGVDGEDEVTFLYEVGEGVAHRSYGLNVAKLAGLPKVVLDVAGVKSRVMEKEEGRRRIENT